MIARLPTKAKPLKDGDAKSERLTPEQVCWLRPTDYRKAKSSKGDDAKLRVYHHGFGFVITTAQLPKSNLFAGMTIYVRSSLLDLTGFQIELEHVQAFNTAS